MAVDDGYTKSLLHLDGANGSTSIIDEVAARTWSGVKQQLSTTQHKFGVSSAYFSAAPAYFYGDGNADYEWGTGDYTVDFWFWIQSGISPAANNCLLDYRPAAGGLVYQTIYFDSSHKLKYAANGATQITGATTIPSDTWQHCAITRASGVTRLFLQGVKQGSDFADSNNYLITASRPLFGVAYDVSSAFGGYIDEIRFSKGIARWVSDFIPPSEPYRVLTNKSIWIM